MRIAVSCCVLVLAVLSCVEVSAVDFSTTIEALIQRTQQQRFNKTTEYKAFVTEEEFKDLYKSTIQFNWYGPPALSGVRDFTIPDNNGFVSMWIMLAMLELNYYVTGGSNTSSGLITDELLFPTVDAVTTRFLDKNHPDLPMMTFWNQTYEPSANMYRGMPSNIFDPIAGFQDVIPLLKLVGEWIPALEPFVKFSIKFGNSLLIYLHAFGLPSDFDDSSVNLALGYYLDLQSAAYPNSYDRWINSPNANVVPLMKKYSEFAYRPFSNDTGVNRIDPRTYLWLRHFLDYSVERANGSEPNVQLITTWMMTVDESNAGFPANYCMPLNINNVDGSVAANSIFGIITTTVRHYDLYTQWWDADFTRTFTDTVELLSWIIRTGYLQLRPDIILLYYPPVVDMYWFVARSVKLLNSLDLQGMFNDNPMVYDAMSYARRTLTEAMRTNGTQQLLQSSNSTNNPGEPAYTFWDEFLGLADLNAQNESAPTYQDRMFSTAVAINALIDTWSVSTTSMVDSVPANVMAAIAQAAQYLNDTILTDKFAPNNAFFSGSGKGVSSASWLVPSNTFEFTNGTRLNMYNVSWDDWGVELGASITGYLNDSDYMTLVKNHTPYAPVPFHFHGYNSEDGFAMPYWCSQPLTHAFAALGLTKAQFVMQN